MSPIWKTAATLIISFPRVSGDEPSSLLSVYPDQRFSPREWG